MLKIGSTKTLRADGDLARDQQLWAEAAGYYKRYLEKEPEDLDIWIQYGHALKEVGNLQEAEAAYRAASSLSVDAAEPKLHLAHVLKQLGRPQQAAVLFRDLMKIAPTTEIFEELNGLGIKTDLRNLVLQPSNTSKKSVRYLELRDLLQYLSHHATVTGITRVVLGLLSYVLNDLDEVEADSYEFVQQYGDADGLSLLSKSKLRRLVNLATAETGDLNGMIDIIVDIRRSAKLIQIKSGDLYFIPGAFWEFVANPSWLSSMKQKGVYVGAYIYDLIPITHTHYCMAELTDAFNIAFAETVRSCDFTLTISEFVATQVKDFLRLYEIEPFPTVAVPLAHELHFDSSRPAAGESDNADLHELFERPYVLCVCTIEARKNHIYLFYIWQRMIDEGLEVPDLVFVGRHGWRVNDLIGQIEASRNLGGKLHIMHGLSDVDLASLYHNCAFTAFPSFVEGWGLPVGESLTYKKVCVASSTTSIPEVGGEFAVYIDPFNLDSGYQTIRKLICEPEYLAKLEQKIINDFIPRTWKDVGKDFFDKLDQIMVLLPEQAAKKPRFAPHLETGMLMRMDGLQKAVLARAQYVRNPMRLMFSEGWRTLETTGTWMREKTAKLRLHIGLDQGQAVQVLLQVGTSPWVTEKNTLSVWLSTNSFARNNQGGTSTYSCSTKSSHDFWIRLSGLVEKDGMLTVQFRLDAPVEASDTAAIPVGVRLHAIGFSPINDYAARMSLLEQSLLGID